MKSNTEILPEENKDFPYILKKKLCLSPEHKPPMYVHIPYGYYLRHTCPDCGEVTEVRPHQITFGAFSAQ